MSQVSRSRRTSWILVVVILGLARVAFGSAGLFYLQNSELKITVTASPGTITVMDRADGFVWHQRGYTDHSNFTNITLLARDELAFDTTFLSGQELPAHVTLRLSGRNLALQVKLDETNTPLTSFDFIEPFQPTTNMSLVVPDFCDGHLYPADLAVWPCYQLDSVRVLNLTMPWAGVVDVQSGRGYAVIFDTPCDAQLKLAQYEGLRSPLAAWNGEKGRFGYTRSLTYSFTANGGYVALAKAYRAAAQAQGLLATFQTKVLTRTNIAKLYGAPALWDFNHNLSDLELRARGMAQAIHHVERWDGERAGRDALETANQLGFVTEEYDYYLGGPVDGGVQHYQDYHLNADQCVEDASSNIVYIGDSSLGHIGLRCPEFYVPVAQKIIPARLQAYPQTARYFDQITQNFYGHDNGLHGGGSTEECWSSSHPGTRRDWVRAVDQFYQYAARTLGLITGAELGKFHQVPDTELFYGMESWSWPWPDASFPVQTGADTNAWNTYRNWAINATDRVPLWELVFHDCTVATWYPWDGNDSCYKIAGWYQDQKDCLNVLYGTPALFLINNPHDSEYFQNPSRWLQSYRNTCKINEALASQEMIQHRFRTPDRLVQETEWSDGTQVVVNFGTNDYWAKVGRAAPQCLKQFCFDAKGPWGGATRAYDPRAGRVVTRLWKAGYCFDDGQLSANQPVSLALWQKKSNQIQVNVDELPGNTNVCFRVRPELVTSSWNFKTTHVYLCAAKDGKRLHEIPWTRTRTGGIELSGLSGWIVLDVEFETNLISAGHGSSRRNAAILSERL